MSRISNSWRLVKASWAVLRADKELIVFPIVSMIAAIIVTIVFIVPSAALGLFEALTGGESTASQLAGLVVLFLFYVVMYTVTFFFNSALVGAAMIRLDGGDPTISDGINLAAKRFGTILGYALIAATVGTILKALSERAGIIGRIVISIIGMVWNIATYLVVPVLVIEDVGPIEAVKRSASLLRQTWGEQIIGNFSIGLVFGLLAVAVIIVGVVVIVAAASADSVALIITAVALLILAVVAISLVGSALDGIYKAAVYRYAVKGEASLYFGDELIQGAFRRK